MKFREPEHGFGSTELTGLGSVEVGFTARGIRREK
jgi:hypothetical protein